MMTLMTEHMFKNNFSIIKSTEHMTLLDWINIKQQRDGTRSLRYNVIELIKTQIPTLFPNTEKLHITYNSFYTPEHGVVYYKICLENSPVTTAKTPQYKVLFFHQNSSQCFEINSSVVY